MDWILLETVNIELLGLGFTSKSLLCSKEEPTQQSSEESDNDFQITPKHRSSKSKEKMHKKMSKRRSKKKVNIII